METDRKKEGGKKGRNLQKILHTSSLEFTCKTLFCDYFDCMYSGKYKCSVKIFF